MKLNKLTIPLAGLLLFSTSCGSDFLNQVPDNEYVEDTRSLALSLTSGAHLVLTLVMVAFAMVTTENSPCHAWATSSLRASTVKRVN